MRFLSGAECRQPAPNGRKLCTQSCLGWKAEQSDNVIGNDGKVTKCGCETSSGGRSNKCVSVSLPIPMCQRELFFILEVLSIIKPKIKNTSCAIPVQFES